MRIIEQKVYTFAELDEAAKEVARNWYRETDDFPWSDEWLDSIKTFVDHFGANLRTWSIGPYCPVDYTVDYDNSNFRGLKLRDFTRDHMPTGYCGDCDLWETFYDVFKSSGDAKHAFEQAVDAGFKAWRDDWEYSLSDEAVDEAIIANEYEFFENGERC